MKGYIVMILKFKRNLKKIVVLLLIFSYFFINNVNAEDNVYIYNDDFSIEYFLKNYNIISLGNKTPNNAVDDYNANELYGNIKNLIHIVGPIMLEGNLGESGKQLYHSQFVQGISSYVKGEILSPGGAGGNTADGTNPIFYVGTINNVEQPYPQQYNYHINGYNWYTTYETIETDYYIDFQKLYKSIREQQEKLDLGEVVTKDESGNIYIKTGGTYNIESLDGVKNIIFEDFITEQDDLTLINILDSGNNEGVVKFPRIVRYNNGNLEEISTNDYYGKNGDTNEIYKGNIVWNILNADYIEMHKSPFVGHFIAPSTDVKMPEMHFAGCFIVNSLYGAGNTEAHMYSLDNNITLPLNINTDNNNSNDNNIGNSNDNNVDDSNTNNDNSDDNIDDSNDMRDPDNNIMDNDDNNINNSDDNQEGIENPNTLDNVTKYSLLIVAAIIVMIISYYIFLKHRNINNN